VLNGETSIYVNSFFELQSGFIIASATLKQALPSDKNFNLIIFRLKFQDIERLEGGVGGERELIRQI